jgi:prepilin-type processing-associated H-X9-DG protein
MTSVKSNMIKKPDKIIFVADGKLGAKMPGMIGTANDNLANYWAGYELDGWKIWNVNHDPVARRHGKFANALYIDGHCDTATSLNKANNYEELRWEGFSHL